MAPSKAYNPPATQTPMNNHPLGNCWAIEPGVLTMPAPIVFPIITASPNPTPRTRSKRPRLADLTGVASSTGCRGTPPLKTGNEDQGDTNAGKSDIELDSQPE